MQSNNKTTGIRAYWLLLIYTLFLIGNCSANELEDNLNFIHVTPEDGLSHFTVTIVAQDS